MNTNVRESEYYRGYRIDIVYDDDVESPREWDNVCTMNCYHRNYSLGDNKCKGDPYEDLRSIILNHIDSKEFIRLVQKHCESVKITHNNAYYFVYEWYDDEWHLYDQYPIRSKYDVFTTVQENALPLIDDAELFTIVDNSSAVAISNIYAYIHSGITISMSRRGQYSCPFDSGCLGYIYVTKQKMMQEFSDLTDQTWEEKAYDVMAKEVNIYDEYLTGECFGWQIFAPLEKDDEDDEDKWDECSEDSCWGYIGSDEIKYMLQEAKAEIDASIAYNEKKAAEAAAELKRKREEIAAKIDILNGEKFIIDGNVYCINTTNLFGYPQVCKEVTESNKFISFQPIEMSNLEESVVNVLYSNIH